MSTTTQRNRGQTRPHGRPFPGTSFLRCPLLVVLLAALALGACSRDDHSAKDGTTQRSPEVSGLDPDVVAANNHGVGLMGQFDYAGAQKVFSDLAARHPELDEVQINLAIATLNRQNDGDEQAALEIVERIGTADPTRLRARYIAGLLRLYMATPQSALPHLRAVVEGDPEDAYAAYYLAQTLAQAGDYETAIARYRDALRLDPYLTSAYYGAFQALRHLRRADEARALIDAYQRLADNPRAHLAEFKYTRMGPKADALAFGVTESPPLPRPEGPLFSPPVDIVAPLTQSASDSRHQGINAADVDGDSRVDLFFAGRGTRPGTFNTLLSDPGGAEDSAVAGFPPTNVDHVNASVWGDIDNDGLIDVYLLRNGGNRLWRQVNRGEWEDITEASGTGAGEFDTVDGAMFDADHDGDLDLFAVNANGPNELLNNNRDGSFRAIAADQGISGTGGGSRQILPVDLDHDRDVDLVVLNMTPPHEIYLNDRLWKYHPAPGFDRFRRTPALALISADRNADGQVELYTLAPEGSVLQWDRGADDHWSPRSFAKAGSQDTTWGQLAAFDADGDGRPDILAATAGGWVILGAGDARLRHDAAPGEPLVGLTPILTNPGHGYSMITLTASGRITLWRPGRGRYPFLAMRFSGREDKANSMRSNASGIGTTVTVRSRDQWAVLDSWRLLSGPGQGHQPLAIGLGGATVADFVEIDWSDGVFQSELALSAGPVHTVTETQRQLSSCPVLFAWNGERFEFVSDLLGVGGIGYAIGPGEYGEPRPWENFLLPAGSLKPVDGRLMLKIAEPMEEAAYLDAARLVAIDLPPGWRMVLDERLRTSGPAPTGEPVFYREEMLPEAATNDRGESVLATLRDRDGTAAPVGELDERFIGRLAGEHVLTLEFAQPLERPGTRAVLVADGWVEYPYSQTNFAAWQAGARFDPPTIESRAPGGDWQVILQTFGYPAGMPRPMSVPLPNLPTGAMALRIRSNMEVYWDRIAVAFAEPPPGVRRSRLPLLEGRVGRTGFARRTTYPQRRPWYDYQDRAPFWDTRYLAGSYTRFGPARALVSEVDDAVAIIGPGEEVHLAFSVPADPVERGWSRYFVLEANGWAKDMDLYTRDGDTLGPLPDTGKPAGPRDALHARYNVRYLEGR